MIKVNSENKTAIEKWNIHSPENEGMHECVKPGREDCLVSNVFRLNLKKGSSYTIESGSLEMNGVLLKGKCVLSSESFSEAMGLYDSFYIPGKSTLEIKATGDMIIYIGGSICEGYGKPFFRKFEKNAPLGAIHQIHGTGKGQREVFFTLNPEIEASRLICGLTWGGDGSWTSWPPHQHEKDLEEVYCYFDMDPPMFGLHLSYLSAGDVENVIAHPVRSGSMILAPVGYHPTVASPGSRNAYFWILASHSHDSRKYDLAILDPVFKNS